MKNFKIDIVLNDNLGTATRDFVFYDNARFYCEGVQIIKDFPLINHASISEFMLSSWKWVVVKSYSSKYYSFRNKIRKFEKKGL